MVGKVIAVPWMANAVESCWNTWTMHASLTLHFAFFTIFAFFAFYAKVPFFLTVSFPCINKHWFIDFSCCWWLTFRYRNAKKTHRRNIGIGIDFNWHWHRFVACVLLLMRWSSKHLIPLPVIAWLLDYCVMQGSEKRIVGYVCNACEQRFDSRFAYEQHRRSKWLIGTPCFSAVEQVSELVATRRANMSTAMLRMAASLPRKVGNNFTWITLKFRHPLKKQQNMHKNANYARAPGLVPGTNPGARA